MRFFVDADSFPSLARDIICRAASRYQISAFFVARNPPKLPVSPLFKAISVPDGPDSADDRIVEDARPGDMAFTRDIPLAARLVEGGITVLNDRGTVYTSENVRTRLSERDFMADLRAAGLAGMGGNSYGKKELKEFADAFDRVLTKLDVSGRR
jgi:hypothetical protein